MRDDVVLGTMNGNVFTMADTLYILSEQFCPTGGIELRRIGYDCEACGETDRWREALYALSPSEVERFKVRLIYNDFKIADENRESKTLRRLLSFYQAAKLDVPRISDTRRKQMIAEFDERWSAIPARLTEKDIAREVLDGEKWSYRLGSTEKEENKT